VERGHLFCITVTFLPDGKRIVTSNTREHTVRIWDVDSGKELHKLEIGDYLHGVKISPDGKKIITEGSDKNLKAGEDTFIVQIWDVESGKKLRQWEDRMDCAFSPDGKKIIMVDFERGPAKEFVRDNEGNKKPQHTGTVRIVDTESGEELHKLTLVVQVDPEKAPPVYGVAFFPDGKKVAIPRHDYIAIWDAQLEKELGKFERQESHPSALSFSFSSDGKKIMVTEHDMRVRGEETTFRIYDLERWAALPQSRNL
jgi:WD40 repeat protein